MLRMLRDYASDYFQRHSKPILVKTIAGNTVKAEQNHNDYERKQKILFLRMAYLNHTCITF